MCLAPSGLRGMVLVFFHHVHSLMKGFTSKAGGDIAALVGSGAGCDGRGRANAGPDERAFRHR